MAGKPIYGDRREQLLANSLLRPSGCRCWTKSLGSHGYGAGTFRRVPFLAHRAAYEEFVGPVPEGAFVLHRCDDRSCISPNHLFLGTHDDNVADMVAKRRHHHGERHCKAKLTLAQVRAIRAARGFSQGDLSRQYGVTQSVISRIRSGQSWRLS